MTELRETVEMEFEELFKAVVAHHPDLKERALWKANDARMTIDPISRRVVFSWIRVDVPSPTTTAEV